MADACADDLAVLSRAIDAFDNALYGVQNRLRLIEIACCEILDYRLSWRDRIVKAFPELDSFVIHVLYKDDADALDHAVRSLGGLLRPVQDAFHQDLEPAIERATGLAE